VLRVVADSNIFVSALVFGGVAARLLQNAVDGKVQLFVSEAILEETLGVMRDKFGRSAEQLEEARQAILSVADMVSERHILDIVKDDPDDNRILECALAAGADAIVSGDKHLLRLKRFEGISIITLREFLGQEREAER
jgi:putative PIN family toxin of toxin-antitoxin system